MTLEKSTPDLILRKEDGKLAVYVAPGLRADFADLTQDAGEGKHHVQIYEGSGKDVKLKRMAREEIADNIKALQEKDYSQT